MDQREDYCVIKQAWYLKENLWVIPWFKLLLLFHLPLSSPYSLSLPLLPSHVAWANNRLTYIQCYKNGDRRFLFGRESSHLMFSFMVSQPPVVVQVPLVRREDGRMGGGRNQKALVLIMSHNSMKSLYPPLCSPSLKPPARTPTVTNLLFLCTPRTPHTLPCTPPCTPRSSNTRRLSSPQGHWLAEIFS